MSKYRGQNKHRAIHPKIFVWSHTVKAEIEYFQEFKNHLKTPLLMPKKEICWTPWELIEKVIAWKKKEICEEDEEDNDQVWCIFDVDDFYRKNQKEFIKAIGNASKNNIKVAYINECFELWIFLHFEKPDYPITRGMELEKKIQQAFKNNGLGSFKKNQSVFTQLLPFQEQAIKNARELMRKKYEEINWNNALADGGNPSTSIHFLIDEINQLLIRNKKNA